jgi:RNA polymerase sigma-70 factor (ECF subfamily)
MSAGSSHKAVTETSITKKANPMEKQQQPIELQIDDKELLEKFQNENSRNFAFSQIVRKYEVRIYHLIRKMVIDHDDANDLTQETFIKVWNNLYRFREQSQLYTWIYRIAVNESLGFLNSKRRKFFLPINDINKELSQKLDTNGGFTGDEIQLKLQKALLQLPDKQRLVFNMKYFEDLSYEEISEIVGTSVGALKASYHHAVKKIELHLQNN